MVKITRKISLVLFLIICSAVVFAQDELEVAVDEIKDADSSLGFVNYSGPITDNETAENIRNIGRALARATSPENRTVNISDKYSIIEVIDVASIDVEATDTEATDTEVIDAEATDIEVTDVEITDNEATDIEVTDVEITDDEATDIEVTDVEIIDDEATDAEITDDEATDVEATDVTTTDDEALDIEATDVEAADQADNNASHLFAAAILSIDPSARVDHIRNVRQIVAGYLQEKYGYEPQEADTLAFFLSYYNAMHRGDVDYLKTRYKSDVLDYVDSDNLGISLNYNDWPGKTRLIIPLISTSEDFSLETMDKDVTTVAREDNSADLAIPEREALNDLRDQRIAENEESIAENDAKIAENENALEIQQAQVDEAQQQAEATQQEAEAALQEAEQAQQNVQETQQQATEIAQQAAEVQQQAAEVQQQAAEVQQKAAEVQQKAEAVHQQAEEIQKQAEEAEANGDPNAPELAQEAEAAQQEAEAAQQEAEAAQQEAEVAQQEAEATQQQAEAVQQDVEQAQQKVEVAQQEAEVAQTNADQAVDAATEAQEQAAQEQAKQDEIQAENEQLQAENEQKSEENTTLTVQKKQEAVAIERDKEVIKERENPNAAEELVDAKRELDGVKPVVGNLFYYMDISERFDNGHYHNRLLAVDPLASEIVASSSMEVCSREFLAFSKGIVAITAQDHDHASGHDLTLFELGTLTPLKTSSGHNIYWNSFVINDAGMLYTIIIGEDGNYYLARFDSDLELDMTSEEVLDLDTSITIYGDHVYVTLEGRKQMVVLNKSDLSTVSSISLN